MYLLPLPLFTFILPQFLTTEDVQGEPKHLEHIERK